MTKEMAKTKPTRGRGRPSEYKPEYCDALIESGKKGKFLFEFANSIGKHVDTMYEWASKHKDFSDAIRLAKQHCLEAWTNGGRALMASPPSKHDSRPWGVIMNNLHGWGEKVHISNPQGGPVEVKLDAESAKQIKEWARSASRRSVGR